MTDTNRCNDTPTPNMRATPGKDIPLSRTLRPLPAPPVPQPYFQDFTILPSKEHYIQAKGFFFFFKHIPKQIIKDLKAGILALYLRSIFWMGFAYRYFPFFLS